MQIKLNALGGSGGAFNILGGNVGIGTSSPTLANSRNGLVLRGNANGAELLVQSTTATNGTSDGFVISAVASDAYLYNRLNGFVAFATNNLERMRITSGGNVGIGTTTANSRLTVFGNIELIPPTTSNAKIRLVTCHGDGGANTPQVYWNIAFGSKAAGGCLGAYDTGGNYNNPSTTITNSSLWTIYGFIGV